MAKRISGVLVAVFLALACMIFPAEAQSEMHTSEAGIAFIKNWEGFSPQAYWDVSQWTIGYGTAGTKGQTITEAEADTAMRAAVDLIDSALNTFIDKYGLNLSQQQFDALSSFSYNCGTLWTKSNGRFRDAVINGETGNKFLFAISLWANAGSQPDSMLIRRRMTEANIYFNGIYEIKLPADYGFVIFDPNGGTAGHGGEDKMQGYIKTEPAEILAADATKTGGTFAGWYTAASGGRIIRQLDDSLTPATTLYARWGIAVTVNQSCNVRSGPGGTYGVVGKTQADKSLLLVDVKTVDGNLWGQFDEGWLALMYTDYSGTAQPEELGGSTQYVSSQETVITTGTVHCDAFVNIRSGAGVGNPVVGRAYNGKQISVYETKNVSGSDWGRTPEGWICLDYVTLANTSQTGTAETTAPTEPETIPTEAPAPTETTAAATEPTETTAPTETTEPTEAEAVQTPTQTAAAVKGTVTADTLNVRQAAGVKNAKVGTVAKGTAVNVYEQTTCDGAPWGRIDGGWVCMNFIRLEAAADTDTAGETTVATGRVSSSTELNVRSGPSVNYNRVTVIPPNTEVKIYETQTTNGVQWGRIGKSQWVCMQYITLTTGTAAAETTGSSVQQTASSGITEARVSSTTNLNVRSGPGTNYKAVDSLKPDSLVLIYETTTDAGLKWARIGTDRWVCMSYLKSAEETKAEDTQQTQTEEAQETQPSQQAKVVSKTALNVRKEPGAYYQKVGSLAPGTVVDILETTISGGVTWGRIESGWICMDYIQLI